MKYVRACSIIACAVCLAFAVGCGDGVRDSGGTQNLTYKLHPVSNANAAFVRVYELDGYRYYVHEYSHGCCLLRAEKLEPDHER